MGALDDIRPTSRASTARGVGRKKRKVRMPSSQENPGRPTRAQIEIVPRLYLRSDPDIVDAVERICEECGYATAPEGVRHLLRIAISATPIDGEFRAAINHIKSQMTRFVTTRYWTLLNKLLAEYEVEWRKIDGNAMVNREVARFRFENGQISRDEYEAILVLNPLEKVS